MSSTLRPGLVALLSTAVVAGSALAVVLSPVTARSATLDPHCEQLPNTQIRCTFPDLGKTAGFVPPAGFTTAEVSLTGGAGGAGGRGEPGGAGGTTSGTLTLPTPAGTALDIYLGDAGENAGTGQNCGHAGDGGHSDNVSYIEGGDGGATDTGCAGGGGGGGTFITVAGVSPMTDEPLAAAGGGGGGGGKNNNAAGGAGAIPKGVKGEGANAGKGGKQDAGGDGDGGGDNGQRGDGGKGGEGGSEVCGDSITSACANGGGGGGGGVFGGGGGGLGSGGGGGAGCLPCPQPASPFVSTSVPGAAGSDTPGPVFHMAATGPVVFLFGTPVVGAPVEPGTPAAPPPLSPGHHSNNNDPNPNTNPDQPTARTTTVLCEPRIGFCSTGPIVGPDSVFVVNASGGTSPAELFGTLQGGQKPDCPGYAERNSDWLVFGFRDPLRGSTWRKLATLTTRQGMDRKTAVALSEGMQICFEAPYRFPTRPGYAMGGHNAVFDGVLPDCTGGGNPCVATRQVLHRKGGWVVKFAFRVPANRQDPKALG